MYIDNLKLYSNIYVYISGIVLFHILLVNEDSTLW